MLFPSDEGGALHTGLAPAAGIGYTEIRNIPYD